MQHPLPELSTLAVTREPGDVEEYMIRELLSSWQTARKVYSQASERGKDQLVQYLVDEGITLKEMRDRNRSVVAYGMTTEMMKGL